MSPRAGHLAVAALTCLTACAASQPERAAPPAARPAGARYFPLERGTSWAYTVETNLEGEQRSVLSTARIVESSAESFVLQTGDERARYTLRPDGIYKETSGYAILREPLELGARWSILDGKGEIRVEGAGATVATPAGTFEGCLVVVEEVFRDQRVEWTYAPEVGPVRMRVFLLGDAPVLVADAVLRGFQRGATE